MTTLRRIQAELQAYLLGTPNAAAARLVDSKPLAADARLRVYAHAYRLRLREALETDFVALRAWLGGERFSELGQAYIAAHPSTHYSLRYFGRHLAAFLAATPPYAGTPLLAELAAFEWALGTAFDASDELVLTRDALKAIPPADWPNLRFRAHASVVRLSLEWNVPAIWKAVDAGAESLPPGEEAVRSVPWVVWRQDLKTFFRSLQGDEAYALDALRRGECFADICAGLCEWTDPNEVAARAAGFLERWIGDGMLRGFWLEDVFSQRAGRRAK